MLASTLCFAVRVSLFIPKLVTSKHVAPREGRGADGQEHHDAQGHQGPPGEQPSSGETAASHPGERGLRVHQGGPH